MIIRTQARSQSSPLAPLASESGKPRNRVMKRKKPAIKPITVAIYAAVFVALVAVVAAGYSTPRGEAVANVSPVSSQDTNDKRVSVNEVVATSVAADVAGAVNLPVATNVANLSTSLAAKSDVAPTSDTTAVTKQQIIQSTGNRRSLTTYTTKAGDTVDKIAKEYGISKETIRWANNLTSDALEANKKLIILPVSGVLHTVKSGDTTAKIAKKYKTSEVRIITFNDLELAGLKKGTKVVVPAGVLPVNERPGYVAPTLSNPYYASSGSGSSSGNFMSGSVGNRYVYGYCTWYAYERRAAMGRPVGSFWGNANTWAAAARAQGFTVSSVPVAGAVFQTSYGGGGYGHVGIIESVDLKSGTVTYSDMNGGAGWNRIGRDTISISQAQSQWVFIY